jgi:hypothetical protein
MKVLLLALYWAFISSPDTTLMRPINWHKQQTISIGTVRTSNNTLTKRDLRQIVGRYNAIKKIFMEFEHLDTCSISPMLDLRIVSNAEINSPDFFDVPSKPGFVYYGRYFRDVKVLYITRQAALYNTEEFAHELAHYFYDTCQVSFRNDDAEHARIEEFQAFLKGKI